MDAFAEVPDAGEMGMTAYDEPAVVDSLSLPEPEALADNALTRFEAEWAVKLQEKAQKEEALRLEAIEAAKVDLETFTSERANQRETRQTSNRNAEQVFLEQLEADLESENPWERIVSLVDTQADQTEPFQDTQRMRTVFIQLKNDPIISRAEE
ncbi:unnamed protein product [Chrysoparadoxa australica]